MEVSAHERRCPKCDNRIDLQTDGSTVTIDIAHNGERVRDALSKLKSAIKQTRSGVAQNLRVIVGTGVIREEAMTELIAMEHRKTIKTFDLEGNNSGAILIRLK